MNKTDTFIPPKNKNDMTSVLKSLIKNKRVGVFIDSANLYYAANKASLKIDYFQVSRWFKNNCELASLNFYTAYDPLDERQNDFFSDLEKSGYTLIKKPIRVFADSVKGNMDIELAVDVLMQQDKFDTLVLISGDGDFQRLIQALDQLGKKTIILGVGGFTSYELHQEADNYFFLNRIQEIWKKPYARAASKDVALPSKLEKDGKDDTHTNSTKSSSLNTPKAPKSNSRNQQGQHAQPDQKTFSGKTPQPSAHSASNAKKTTKNSHSSPAPAKQSNTNGNKLPRVRVKVDPKSKPQIILE